MNTAVICTLCLASLLPVALGWGSAERDQILKMHNDYRRGTKEACHMNKIEYDESMEKDAEAYAKKCVYQHKFDKYGENFAYDTTTSSPSSQLIKSAIDAWYGEIKTYTYGQNACGDSQTCHYTQIVAASAKKIGCYAHVCPNLQNAAPNAWFFVCYYTPKGNWKGENAFPKDCKTKCLKGQTEEDGLCVGEGEEEGKGNEPFVCKDTIKYCKIWKETAQCEMNPTYMKKKCPVACGVCTPEGGDAEEKGASSCVDNDPRCPMYAERGECERRAEHMKIRCPKSCKHC